MKNLRPETLGIVQRVEALSGCPVEFQPDSSLSIQVFDDNYLGRLTTTMLAG